MMSYFDPNKALYNGPIIYPNTELHQFMLYLKENPSLSDFYVTSDIFTKIVTMSNLDDALLILETTPYDIIKNEAVPDAPPPLPHEIYHGSFYNIDTRLHTIPPEHVQFFVDKLKNDLVEGFDYFKTSCKGMNELSVASLYANANDNFTSKLFLETYRDFLSSHVTPLTATYVSLTSATVRLLARLRTRHGLVILNDSYEDDITYCAIMNISDDQ